MNDSYPSTLPRLLEIWRNEPTIASNIVQWHTEMERPAQWAAYPVGIHPGLETAAKNKGIEFLYSHQLESWQALQNQEDVVIVTETASGKTLCYNLPVIDAILKAPKTRALYLYPTKALAYDQQKVLEDLLRSVSISVPQNAQDHRISAAVYDGDTPSHKRSTIRAQAQILLTNPDMLHTGILPHHTLWADFLRGLKYVVIDEIHTYRGVFGSHIANLIRRLKRILRFYGAHPQFILTSATIANPAEHATRLIEEPVTLIAHDGSPHGSRHFLIYNPPVMDPHLGIRKSASQESIRLASDLLNYQVQTLIFGRARRTVEMILKNFRHEQAGRENQIHAYRSGYLPGERRAIENGLKQGEIRAVVSTNALELGVDIGGMDAVLLIGYPGTIAATRQQAGRAGRQHGNSLAVLIASAGPLDQFLVKHPEFLFSRSPERALINPDNPLILLQHLRCAAFELSFQKEDPFGSLDGQMIQEYLAFLTENGELHETEGRYFWMADAYPAGQISLRTASAQPVLLQAEIGERQITVGLVDQPSACWMVHPEAIYLHEGQSFQVESLDLEKNIAHLVPVETDFYTDPQKEVTIEKLSVIDEEILQGCSKAWGEILVTTQVTGYRRIRWFTHEILGAGQVDLPPTQLRTTGFWLSISQATVEMLRSQNQWKSDPNDYGPNWIVQRNRARERDQFICQVCGAVEMGRSHHVHHKVPFRTFTTYLLANQLDNLITVCPSCHKRIELAVRMRSGLAGLSYVLNQLAPLFLMCDTTDLGSYADPEWAYADGAPTVVIYDKVPAGIGLSDSIYRVIRELVSRAHELVKTCECQDGCPSCIGPAGENGVGGKEETLALLSLLDDQP